MSLRVLEVTGPTSEPLSLEQVKDHLRLMPGDTLEDDYIERLVKLARQKVENLTNRKLLSQTWKVYLDEWPSCDEIELPFAPVQSVPTTGITYTNSTGNTTTFSSTAWVSDTVSEPGRIVLKNDDSWPTATLYSRNPIAVEFVTGYTTGSKVPEPLRQAMLLLVSHNYEYREPIISMPGGAIVVPKTVEYLIADYRLWSF